MACPQIEVSFDIDANGIVNVSARDKGTWARSQSIVIQSSGGLSEDEIQKMIHESESFADSDKKKKEMIETRNEADNLIYNTEKQLKEHEKKLDDATKASVKKSVDDLREAMKGEDVEAIKSKVQAVQQEVHEDRREGVQDGRQRQCRCCSQDRGEEGGCGGCRVQGEEVS